MAERLLGRWRGVLLSLIGIVAIGWLAATGRLGLYIHPRYFAFSLVMAGIAAVFTVVAFAVLPARDPEEDHDHAHAPEHDHDHARRGSPWASAVTVLLVLAATAGLLALQPTTLSAAVQQRAIGAVTAGGATAGGAAPALSAHADTSAFTVRDWANLLRAGADPAALASEPVDLTGFVVPDPHDGRNVFYLSRLAITCCAVDAQPVGVPVYLPDWPARFPAGQWLHLTGTFRVNPSTASIESVALLPTGVTETTQPAQPYVY